MTDNEIIKELEQEIHLVEYIGGSYSEHASLELLKGCFDLISRQKDEIERIKTLEYLLKTQRTMIKELAKVNDNIRTKTINEFAEVMKKELLDNADNDGDINSCLVPYIIDRLVKVMDRKE